MLKTLKPSQVQFAWEINVLLRIGKIIQGDGSVVTETLVRPAKSATSQLCVLSIAFLLGNRDDAIVWRGPSKDIVP